MAGIERDEAETVYGVVYEMNDADLERLDGYEGLAAGNYHRAGVTVMLDDGSTVSCWTYIAAAEAGGPFTPSDAYLDTILDGARDHDLPESCLHRLEASRGRR